MVIVLSLDGLLERCKAASTNTVSCEDDVMVTSLSCDVPSCQSAKRKVEDIATKLTTLSDLLRESKVLCGVCVCVCVCVSHFDCMAELNTVFSCSFPKMSSKVSTTLHRVSDGIT